MCIRDSFAIDSNTNYGFTDLAPVTFNYLGQFEAEKEATDWQIVMGNSGDGVHPDNKSNSILFINGAINKGVLGFSINSKLGIEATESFSNSFKQYLENIIAHCKEQLANTGSTHTPSDFNTVSISQTLLTNIEEASSLSGNSIAAIYPATSLQQGFIYHALRNPSDDAYRVQVLYAVSYTHLTLPTIYSV